MRLFRGFSYTVRISGLSFVVGHFLLRKVTFDNVFAVFDSFGNGVMEALKDESTKFNQQLDFLVI